MKLNEIRVTNLRKLIDQNGGVNAFAAKLGYVNGSFMSQMAGPNPVREVSERTARKIEQAMGIAEGWMDRADVAAAAPVVIDHRLVSEAIQMTAAAVEKSKKQMSPTKLGKIATMVYTDAVAKGSVSETYIAELLSLFS